MIGLLIGEAKRRRAAAVQDAGALTESSRIARSVWECASPLALWEGRTAEIRGGAGRSGDSAERRTWKAGIRWRLSSESRYACIWRWLRAAAKRRGRRRLLTHLSHYKCETKPHGNLHIKLVPTLV